MNNLSLGQRVLRSKQPFILFHTWTVTKELLQQAIAEGKSMDLDVCVDDVGNPYLGHSKEYHEKSGEPYFNSIPIWEAIDMIAKSNIAAMLDCKHYDAWPVIEEVITRIGPERCLVSSYVPELKFDYSRQEGEPDFLTEWSPIQKLRELKEKFPAATAAACAKWLPLDLLVLGKYDSISYNIRNLLKENKMDTVCLGGPDEKMSDKWLKFFLEENIIPQIPIDNIDTSKLTEVYIGETDHLESASTVDAL